MYFHCRYGVSLKMSVLLGSIVVLLYCHQVENVQKSNSITLKKVQCKYGCRVGQAEVLKSWATGTNVHSQYMSQSQAGISGWRYLSSGHEAKPCDLAKYHSNSGDLQSIHKFKPVERYWLNKLEWQRNPHLLTDILQAEKEAKFGIEITTCELFKTVFVVLQMNAALYRYATRHILSFAFLFKTHILYSQGIICSPMAAWKDLLTQFMSLCMC